MKDRKKKQRALEAAGIVHAAGHVFEADAPKVAKLVAKAADKVKEVLKDG